jgi:hypothetical protein
MSAASPETEANRPSRPFSSISHDKVVKLPQRRDLLLLRSGAAQSIANFG